MANLLKVARDKQTDRQRRQRAHSLVNLIVNVVAVVRPCTYKLQMVQQVGQLAVGVAETITYMQSSQYISLCLYSVDFVTVTAFLYLSVSRDRFINILRIHCFQKYLFKKIMIAPGQHN